MNSNNFKIYKLNAMNCKEYQNITMEENHKFDIISLNKSEISPLNASKMHTNTVNTFNKKESLQRPILRRMKNECIDIHFPKNINKTHECFMYSNDITSNILYCFFCDKKIERNNE